MQLMEMQRSREFGKAIPGWQAGRFPVITGNLLIAQEYRARLRRYSLTARMHGLDAEAKAPPELWDCQLQRMTKELWVVSGFETIDDGLEGLVDYAQTWVLTPVRNTTAGCYAPGLGFIT